MTTFSRKPRARERIGADAARVWARELSLGNPYAKSILLAIANYMNEDGAAWPGLATISRDTDIGEETVAKRLRWLESIGAVAMFKCWRDENGRRNFDGRGKPSASEIRFLFDADIETIQDAARQATEPRPLRGAARKAHDEKAASEGDDDAEVSAPDGRGLNSDQHPVSPPVAPDQPPTRAERHIDSLEQEQEEPPNPPAGGGRVIDQELENDIAKFAQIYPGPITNLPRLRIVLGAMTAQERCKVLIAVKGYADYIAECERKKKPRAIKDADRWVAQGMWQGYVSAGERSEVIARKTNVDVDSQGGKAWAVLHRIAHVHPFEAAGFYLLPDAPSARLLALASAPPEQDWKFIAPDQINQCGAWDEFVRECLHGKSRPPLITERNPGGRRGFYAPWPWPPRVDGTLSTTGPPDHNLSEEDAEALSNWK